MRLAEEYDAAQERGSRGTRPAKHSRPECFPRLQTPEKVFRRGRVFPGNRRRPRTFDASCAKTSRRSARRLFCCNLKQNLKVAGPRVGYALQRANSGSRALTLTAPSRAPASPAERAAPVGKCWYRCRDRKEQIAECDENLCGPALTPSEKARFTARRKEAYEALHPETKHGASGVGREKSSQVEDSNPAERFTLDTAKKTGVSEATVQRDAERGEKVIPEVISLIAGTKLDTGLPFRRNPEVIEEPPHTTVIAGTMP